MKLAVVRIRGVRKVAPRIKKTLEFLRLEKPNHCVLVENTPQNVGMLNHAKDYVTFGPVEEGTIFGLLRKKGRKGSKLLRTLMKEAELKQTAKEIFGGKKTADFANPVFRLKPPSRGYRDIRVAFPAGELGRRDAMDPLLRRMI